MSHGHLPIRSSKKGKPENHGSGAAATVPSPYMDPNPLCQAALHARSHIGIKKCYQVSIKLANPVVWGSAQNPPYLTFLF